MIAGKLLFSGETNFGGREGGGATGGFGQMSKFWVIGGSTPLSPSRANLVSVKIHNLLGPGYKKNIIQQYYS